MSVMQWLKQQAGFPGEPSAYEAYCREVQRAWDQWQAAQNLFDNVSDPDLVDYAIYDLEASRRRYVYMLRRSEQIAREEREQTSMMLDPPGVSPSFRHE